MTNITLTDSMVRAATASAGTRLEVTDAHCAGLVLRVTDRGAKSFTFKYRCRANGKVARITLGAYPGLSLRDARMQADTHRRAVHEGRDPQAEKVAKVIEVQGAVTFDAMVTRYIDEYAKPRKSSWRSDDGFLKRPRAAWGHRPAASITDDDAAQLLDQIATTAPISANRTQSVLHKLFSWAREPGRKFVTVNPLAGMPRRAPEKQSDRVLTDAELKTFWRGLDDAELPAARAVSLALRFILLTMARPGEAAGAIRAELRDLDGETPEWHLPGERTKNGRAHIIPLSDEAVAVIREAMPDGQPVVFASKYESRASVARHSLSQALIEIRAHLNLAQFTPHDLRRTAATIARRGGAARGSVKAMLNHAEDDVTGVYDRYEMLAEKRNAAAILGAELMRVVRAGSPTKLALI